MTITKDIIDLSSIINDDEAGIYDKLSAGFLQKRILIFNQDVTAMVIDDAISWILQWNIEDVLIPKKERVPITIFIHSYGGDMYAAGPMMDIIRSSETPIRVVGLGLFLQHDGEIDVQNSSGKAKDTMAFFDGMNERVKQYVLDRTTIDEELYDKNKDREMYMYADRAKERGIVHKIIGEDISRKQIFK